MDNARYADDEYTTQSTKYCPDAAHGNGMFSSSHHFTVTAQSLTNITKNYTTTPNVPSDVRTFSLGDIDLQHEIRVDGDTGVVDWQISRPRVRRIYSARIESRKSSATVAMYQGDGAEEEWRQDVAKYMAVRHPNIIQIAGIANSGIVQAALFTDDLIPSKMFRDLHCRSHLLLVYFYVCCSWDWDSLSEYLDSTFQERPGGNCTKWIRRSTGRFCAELDDSPSGWTVHTIVTGLERSALIRSNPEIAVIDSLTIQEYHEICARGLSLWRPSISHLTTMEITVGAVLCGAAGNSLEDPAEIAVLENPDVYRSRWEVSRGDTQIMENGWTRLNSHDVWGKCLLNIYIPFEYPHAWLSQANHIFHRLGIVSNFKNYVVVDRVAFPLNLSPSDEEIPPGFLFLCPEEDFRTGPASFRWPDLPAYWSLDPCGIDRLSSERATSLGFPLLQFHTTVEGYSWDASVYDGIRKFHQAKGFDPYTQDVALHLGDPLYQVDKEDYWGGVYGYHQSGDYLRALFSENTDNDDTSSCSEETHELSTINCGSDPTEASNCQISHRDHKYEVSALDPKIGKGNYGSHILDQEISPTFKVLFNIQLTLILFLGMSWLYEQM